MEKSIKANVAVVCAVDLSVKALLRPQICAMEQAGYNVTIICSYGELVATLRQQGMEIKTIEISRSITPLRDIKTLFRLVRFFRYQKIDIIHTHTPKAAFLGQLAAWLARVPIRINTIHGLYYINQKNKVKRWFFKTLEILACKLSTSVLSQSQEDVDMLLEQGYLSKSKLQWLGNGIDLSRFDAAKYSTEDKLAVRLECDIPKDAFVVGILARMVQEKGFEELFQAFAELHKTVPNAYLLHIGFVDRSRNDQITPERAEQIGVAEYCRFLGQRDDIPRLMNAMDIFVLPSHREGYPRSVMEANAMGIPAIVTNIRGCREAVQDRVNGLIVPVRDPGELLIAMKKLHDDSVLRDKLSGEAIKHAEVVFDERRVIRVILDNYSQELRRNSIV